YPLRITLFEASSRLGGKILTPRFQTVPATYEAGAAEFYDYSESGEDPLRDLVEELGLSITRMEGHAILQGDRVLTNLDDLRGYLGDEAAKQWRAWDHRAFDLQTPQEFYRADHTCPSDARLINSAFVPFLNEIKDERVRHLISILIHSDLATEPDLTNLEYGTQNYLMNNPRYMRLYSIDGGNERLTQSLATRLQAEICLNHRVEAVQRDPSGRLVLTMQQASQQSTRAFDCVILALPHAALAPLHFPQPLLAEAMARHLGRYDYPAHYLRITMLFEKPFWRTLLPESFAMLDAFDGCCLYDESRRHPGSDAAILGWLIAGQAALRLSEQSDTQLIEVALDSLPPSIQHGRPLLREARIHRWIGAVNGMPGGREPISLDARHQPEPRYHPHLWVVGDYLFDSTLNGVLDSADYVAQWVVSPENELRSIPA
ncbi:MAG: FAD-dependent oxidoreductase, partial [Gemmataceae bacterium]